MADNLYKRDDFILLEHGPYGRRYSYYFDEDEVPPTMAEVAVVVGEPIAGEVAGEGENEIVYFAAAEYDPNTVATYQVQ